MPEGQTKLILIKSDSKLDQDGKQILATLKHLDRKLFKIYLICPPGPLSAEAKLIKDINVWNATIKHLFFINSYFSIQKALQKARSEEPVFRKTIVHTYGFWAGFWLKYFKFEEFIFVHTVSYKKLDKKIVFSQNLLFVPHSHLVLSLLKAYNFAKEKIKMIPQAVDVESIRQEMHKLKLIHPNKTPVIGISFDKFAKKEVDFALALLHNLRKIYPLMLLNVLTDEQSSYARDTLAKRDSGRFISIFAESRMREIMKKWDLFISHAGDHEKSVIAMYAGIPTIMAKKMHAHDTMTHRTHGLHYDGDDLSSLVKRSRELLANSALASKFRREAKEHSKKFSFENIAKAIEREYISLLKEASGK